MTDGGWSKRLENGRAAAGATMTTLSTSAQEAAQIARARIGSTYGQARNRAASFANDGKALAQDGAALGARVAASGRSALDRAMLSSRDLIAERPVTAVVAGLTAGIVLGFLANRLAQQRKEQREFDENDDFIGG